MAKTDIPFNKYFKLCICLLMSFVYFGCSTVMMQTQGMQSVPLSDLQAEIDYFEKTKGISCSDLPEFYYDTADLKVGSTVKFKMTNSRAPDKPFYLTQTLKDIQTTDNGKLYSIDVNISDSENKTLNNSGYQIQKENSNSANAFKLSSFVCPDEIKITSQANKTNPEQPKIWHTGESIPYAALHTVLFGGYLIPTVAAVGITEAVGYGAQKNFDKYYKQTQEAMEAIKRQTTREVKILGVKKLPDENLSISRESFSTKVFQIDTVTLTKAPSYNKGDINFPASEVISRESKKVWISDKLPFFNAVKTEVKVSSLSSYSVSKAIKYNEQTNIFEMEDFKLR